MIDGAIYCSIPRVVKRKCLAPTANNIRGTDVTKPNPINNGQIENEYPNIGPPTPPQKISNTIANGSIKRVSIKIPVNALTEYACANNHKSQRKS